MALGTRTYLAAPVKLLALFVLLSGIPLVALGWLGWRLLEQDRVLEAQRLRERLENAAGILTQDLDRALSAWENLLPAAAQGNLATPPPDTVILLFDAGGLLRRQGIRLPYYPRSLRRPKQTPVYSPPRRVRSFASRISRKPRLLITAWPRRRTVPCAPAR